MQVFGSSVVLPYSLPPPPAPPPPPQAVRTGWLVFPLLHELDYLPNLERLWADAGKKILQKDQCAAEMSKNICLRAARLCLSLPLLL